MTFSPIDHRPARRAVTLGCVVALGLALAACETSFTMSDLNPFGSSEPQPCPPGGALADAAVLTEFGRGNDRSDKNVVYKARIDRTVFDCQVTGDRVVGRVAMVGTVEIGRKGKAGDFTLPVFIALTRNNSEVVSKRFDTIEVTVARGSTTAQFEKTIPDFSFELASRPSLEYEVLTGFNLTPEQVEYNRKAGG
jgi:hypothetical protein